MRLTVRLDDLGMTLAVRRAFRREEGGAAGVAVEFVPSWEELGALVGEAEWGLGWVVAQSCPPGAPPAWPAHLARLEALAPAGARERWILYFPRPHPPSEVLQEFGRMGFPFLLFQGVDDHPQRILRCLARAQVRLDLRCGLLRRGEPLSPACRARLLREVAGWPPLPRIEEEARREHRSPRDYRRAFRKEHLPPPRRLRACGRVLELAALVRAGVAQKGALAGALELAGGDSVEKLFERRTGRNLSLLLAGEEPMDLCAWFLDEVLGSR